MLIRASGSGIFLMRNRKIRIRDKHLGSAPLVPCRIQIRNKSFRIFNSALFLKHTQKKNLPPNDGEDVRKTYKYLLIALYSGDTGGQATGAWAGRGRKSEAVRGRKWEPHVEGRPGGAAQQVCGHSSPRRWSKLLRRWPECPQFLSQQVETQESWIFSSAVDPDPDPGGQTLPTKIEKKLINFIFWFLKYWTFSFGGWRLLL